MPDFASEIQLMNIIYYVFTLSDQCRDNDDGVRPIKIQENTSKDIENLQIETLQDNIN